MSNIKILYVYPHDVKKVGTEYHHPYLPQILKGYSLISTDITCIFSSRPLTNLEHTSKETLVSAPQINVLPKVDSILGILKLENQFIEDEVRKADLIITKLPSFEGVIAVKYAKKYNKKIFVEMVGCPWDAYYNHSLKGKLVAPYATFLTKKYVKKADYVQYVSNQFLQRRYPAIGYNIGCSDVKITPIVFDSIKDKYQNFTKKEKLVLGTSAAIDVKYKGQAAVIKLLPMLNKGNKVVEYHLAGGGDKTQLENLAKSLGVENKVKFLGLLDKKGVNQFLDQTDIYIQPSKQEGLSRALVEAMSRGCFCIASNVGGNPELIEDQYVYDVSKPKEIFDIVSALTQEQMIKTSRRNFDFAKRFDANILNERLVSFYNKILSDNLEQ